MIRSRLKNRGYVVNRKKVARLLTAWGFSRSAKKAHPNAQGKPFDIIAPNVLSQTDMTSVWCGEDGWGYLTAIIDCFDRSILSWSFDLSCRATAFLHGRDSDEDITVTLHRDNGTQFTSHHFREVADDLGITLSRTVDRDPDGNAFIERVLKAYKEEAVWPHHFQSYEEAKAELERWLIDTTRSGPDHHSPN